MEKNNDGLYTVLLDRIREAGKGIAASEAGELATEEAVIRRIRKKGKAAEVLRPVAAAVAITAIAAVLSGTRSLPERHNNPGYAEYSVRESVPASAEPKIYTAYKNSRKLKEKIMPELPYIISEK